MKFFQNRNFLNKSEYKSIINYNNGWHSNKSFSHLLKQELKRSYRTKSPLSYITIDLTAVNDKVSSKLNSDYHTFLKSFLQLLSEKIREIDPDLAHFMVPNCVYRGGICPEPRSCGNYKVRKYRGEDAEKEMRIKSDDCY